MPGAGGAETAAALGPLRKRVASGLTTPGRPLPAAAEP